MLIILAIPWSWAEIQRLSRSDLHVVGGGGGGGSQGGDHAWYVDVWHVCASSPLPCARGEG